MKIISMIAKRRKPKSLYYIIWQTKCTAHCWNAHDKIIVSKCPT
jgi:hypothetical protein